MAGSCSGAQNTSAPAIKQAAVAWGSRQTRHDLGMSATGQLLLYRWWGVPGYVHVDDILTALHLSFAATSVLGAISRQIHAQIPRRCMFASKPKDEACLLHPYAACGAAAEQIEP